MIFVTVGTQLAFDRMLAAVDAWAGRNPDTKVFAQTGPTRLQLKNLECKPFVSPSRADQLVQESSLIVAHAGMGSILTAMRHSRPILIMPRHASLGEHRNDHQLATARWLATRPGVVVAWNEQELVERLDQRGSLGASGGLPPVADGPLVQRLHAYLQGAGIGSDSPSRT